MSSKYFNFAAIIPARSGSKRLPKKNSSVIAGKPLIEWTIETAKASQCFSEILVSTDSKEIAEISRRAGASVPWLRPDSLAQDDSSTHEVVLHVLDYFKTNKPEVNAIMLLQPTSPLRTIQTIERAISTFVGFNGQRSVISISPIKKNLQWLRWRDEHGYLAQKEILKCDEPPYMFNGLVYLSSVNQYYRSDGFINESTYGLIIEDIAESIDIDDVNDWSIAEKLLKY